MPSPASTSWRSTPPGRTPKNIALASAGTKRPRFERLSQLGHSPARTPQRRPLRQQPELDFQRTGQGLGGTGVPGDCHHQPRRLGPRPRAEIQRPPGRSITDRGRGRLERLAFGRDLGGSPTATSPGATPKPTDLCRLVAGRNAEAKKLADERAEHVSSHRRAEPVPMIYGGTFEPDPGPTYRLSPRRPDAAARSGRTGRTAASIPVKFSLTGRQASATASLNQFDGEPTAPSCPGPLDHRSSQPTDRASDRQPHLAIPLWRRPREHAERLRRQRRPAHAPGTARLAGRRVHVANLSSKPRARLLPTQQFRTLRPALTHPGASIPSPVIVNSAAYRQASDVRPDCLAVDAGSRLLWRFPPRRLEAERFATRSWR